MDSKIFLQWDLKFIEEMKPLRNHLKYLMITLDGLRACFSYEDLRRLKEACIVTIAPPVHTSLQTQVLVYSVFALLKHQVRREWNNRLLAAQANGENDLFTICEIILKASVKSVTERSIVSGFRTCGL